MKLLFLQNKFLIIFLLFSQLLSAQETASYKTVTDITVDEVGNAVCEFKTKYNAEAWDTFLKTVGSNTSILKNNLIKSFPKYELTDFNYSQDTDERTNTIKFKILGMMAINKEGDWTTDLDAKDPDVTKLSDTDFLLTIEGNAMKIHLPPGTEDAKIAKNTFNKAILTYPADEGGALGSWPMILGILMVLGGGYLLFRNMKAGKQLNTVYDNHVERERLDGQKQRNLVNGHNNAHQKSTSPPLPEQPLVVDAPVYRNSLDASEMAAAKQQLTDAEQKMLDYMDPQQQEKFLLAKYNEANGFK